jgi:hypothetical protein
LFRQDVVASLSLRFSFNGIHNLDVGGFAVLPDETNPLPVIDPDAVLASAGTLESLQVQAGTFEIVERAG